MDDSKLMENRSYFIGDRIAFTQILLRYRTYRYYGRDTPEGVFPKEKVEAEWKEHGLEKTKNEKDNN